MSCPHDLAVLSVAQMYRADAAAVAGGVAGMQLMEAAGWAVARAIRRRWRPRRVAVLCGPGNNGGDGFVVARLLAAWGWPVRVWSLGPRAALTGDAAANAARWRGPVAPLSLAALAGEPLVVDALFGAGLARPLAGVAAEVIAAVVAQALEVVAVDVPSGVHGDSGRVLGCAPQAAVTVTFFHPKPGHLLLPGRLLAGEVVVADIGIPAAVLGEIAPDTFRNAPGLWTLPRPRPQGHKYQRGHAVVVAGATMTGAGRLAAQAARRVGAGLVTVAAPSQALAVFRGAEPGAVVRDVADYGDLLADSRHNAVLVGPGNGVGPETATRAAQAVAAGKAVVLDADALTSLAGALPPLTERCLLTPHDGEFTRLFPHLADGDSLVRARAAARACGAVVLLKGADTVVAHPDGRAAINTNAPPWLASGGTGDVLAGLAVGLMAQGLDAFSAGAAAAWLHGEAAVHVGPGLIAEDLDAAVARVLREYSARTDCGRGGGSR